MKNNMNLLSSDSRMVEELENMVLGQRGWAV